eukprot:GEMP01035335.1.p1 GENE.GEMP01035335.1~~GEMP01035335.1.p1  ORF type:complete len:371 (-),score=72.84 GEMP01035335.1:259-1371(-)
MNFSLAEMIGVDDAELGGAREDESVVFGGVYEHAARVVSAGKVLTFLHKRTARSLVYLTMIFGDYNKYLEKYMRRAEALGIYYLVIYCLDDEAWAICRRVDEDRCIRGGTRSMLNKFALPLVFLGMGVDVFYVDVDTFWMRNPTPYLLQRLEETNAEMLVSASFADDCICSGIIYWGATRVVRTWLFWLLSWMYEHFHIDDQQILSAFLHHGDVENLTRPEMMSDDIDFQDHFLPRLPRPRWAILDPVVQFAHAWSLNTTGWTGDLDDMVMFHFLGGSNEFNAESTAANWTSKYGESAASNRNLGDVFYGEPLAFYLKPNTTLTDSIKAEVYRSWRPVRPKEMLHCGEVLGAIEPNSREIWVLPNLQSGL